MIEFRTLGSLDLTRVDGASLSAVVTHPKRIAVLTYLALATPRGFHCRDTLIGLFWPELDQEHARHALRQMLYALRQHLGDDAIMRRGDEGVALSESHVWCDAVACEAAMDAGQHERVLELYRGDLLRGLYVSEAPEFERWLEDERVRLRERAAGTAWRLAHEHIETGRLVEAERTAQRALLLVATDESEVRRFIEALARAGDRAAAVRFYDKFAQRLEEEYDVAPAAETAAVAEAVRRADGSVAGQPKTATGPVAAQKARPIERVRRAVPRKRLAIGMAVLAALLVVVAGVPLWAWLRPTPAPLRTVTRMSIRMPEGEEILNTIGTDVALSPDGTRLAYVGRREGGTHILLRSLDQLHATPLVGTKGPVGTEGVADPFFSPDGGAIGFLSGSELKVVSTAGAPPVTLVDFARFHCGDWGPDGMVYFGSADGGIGRVPATGGASEVVTRPDTSRGEAYHNAVDVLPNGKGALFAIWRGQWDDADVAVVEFATGEVRVLVRGFHPRYAVSGHLMYVRSDGVLLAAPFDQDELALTGPAAPLLEGVELSLDGAAELALSQTGTLVYRTGERSQSRPVWVDRDGVAQEIDPGWTGGYIYFPALSPDGTRLAVSMERQDYTGRHIWIKTLDRGPLSRLTFEGATNQPPAWTPDGRAVTFGSTQAGQYDIWEKRADGTGSAILLLDLEGGYHIGGVSWSADGRWLIFRMTTQDGNRDVYAIWPGVDSLAVPLVTTEFDEISPALSPDGQWLAYASDESGRFEVYVRPFPNAGAARWQVSTAGGADPLWAHNGRELFYRNAERELVAVEVATRPTFAAGTERVLFSVAGYQLGPMNHSYAVSPDDQRFVMLEPVEGRRELVLVLNWFEEMRQRVGSGND